MKIRVHGHVIEAGDLNAFEVDQVYDGGHLITAPPVMEGHTINFWAQIGDEPWHNYTVHNQFGTLKYYIDGAQVSGREGKMYIQFKEGVELPPFEKKFPPGYLKPYHDEHPELL